MTSLSSPPPTFNSSTEASWKDAPFLSHRPESKQRFLKCSIFQEDHSAFSLPLHSGANISEDKVITQNHCSEGAGMLGLHVGNLRSVPQQYWCLSTYFCHGIIGRLKLLGALLRFGNLEAVLWILQRKSRIQIRNLVVQSHTCMHTHMGISSNVKFIVRLRIYCFSLAVVHKPHSLSPIDSGCSDAKSLHLSENKRDLLSSLCK